MTDSKGQ